MSNTKYTAILKGLHNAIALDYHYEKQLIYWTDVSMDVIRRAFINGTGTQGNASGAIFLMIWIKNIYCYERIVLIYKLIIKYREISES